MVRRGLGRLSLAPGLRGRPPPSPEPRRESGAYGMSSKSMTNCPSRIRASFTPSSRCRSTRAATTRGWRRGDVDAVQVDDGVRAGELRRPHRAAEVVAAPEGDVQAQLLVQQDAAGGLEAEVAQHAQAQFGQVGVGRLRERCARPRRAHRARWRRPRRPGCPRSGRRTTSSSICTGRVPARSAGVARPARPRRARCRPRPRAGCRPPRCRGTGRPRRGRCGGAGPGAGAGPPPRRRRRPDRPPPRGRAAPSGGSPAG